VKAELEVSAIPLDRAPPADVEIAVRARLIETIRDFLASRGVQVESAPREGVLRLPAGQYFAPGGAVPLPAGQTMMSHLGEALGRWLPCMANGAPPPDAASCRPFTEARLRTVRIETHAEPGQQTVAEAESLTGARAVHLLSGLLGSSAHLLDLRNDAAERLLDVRGMGSLWPLALAVAEPGPAEPAKPAPAPAPAPAKGAAGKKDSGQKDAGRNVPAKAEPPQPPQPPQSRSQRIDLRFDVVVPGMEQPGQAGGLILRPTAK
jgi:hypothetical protein